MIRKLLHRIDTSVILSKLSFIKLVFMLMCGWAVVIFSTYMVVRIDSNGLLTAFHAMQVGVIPIITYVAYMLLINLRGDLKKVYIENDWTIPTLTPAIVFCCQGFLLFTIVVSTMVLFQRPIVEIRNEAALNLYGLNGFIGIDFTTKPVLIPMESIGEVTSGNNPIMAISDYDYSAFNALSFSRLYIINIGVDGEGNHYITSYVSLAIYCFIMFQAFITTLMLSALMIPFIINDTLATERRFTDIILTRSIKDIYHSTIGDIGDIGDIGSVTNSADITNRENLKTQPATTDKIREVLKKERAEAVKGLVVELSDYASLYRQHKGTPEEGAYIDMYQQLLRQTVLMGLEESLLPEDELPSHLMPEYYFKMFKDKDTTSSSTSNTNSGFSSDEEAQDFFAFQDREDRRISELEENADLDEIEIQLGKYAAYWRGTEKNSKREHLYVKLYTRLLNIALSLGLNQPLDIEAELPDELMPLSYMQRFSGENSIKRADTVDSQDENTNNKGDDNSEKNPE